MPEAVILVGATSVIGRALAVELAGRGHPLVLAARDAGELAAVAADLRLRHGVAVHAERLDVLDAAGSAAALEACFRAAGAHPAGFLLTVGHMEGDGPGTDDERRRVLEINFTAVVPLIEAAAARLQASGGGFVCALTSVAGDRGRPANYPYGAAKAGLSVYLQGLRTRLGATGVRVIDVKLGRADTRMTYGMSGPAPASPRSVARAVARALGGSGVVYVPAKWRWIMMAVRAIPEPIFRRLGL